VPVVLYGIDAWSLTLREKRRLRVSENRVLRRLFGYEEIGEWRKLHNEELNDLYSSLNIVPVMKQRRIRWAGHVAHMGRSKGAYRVSVGKPERKRPFGRPRLRWEDIKLDLEEVGMGAWAGLIWLKIGTSGGHLQMR